MVFIKKTTVFFVYCILGKGRGIFMANIEDYIKWRGDLSFQQDPFNDVDSLILSQIAYVDFEGIVPDMEMGNGLTLSKVCDKFFRVYNEEELKKVKTFIWYAPFFMRTVAKCARFGNIVLKNYSWINDDKKQTQFVAFTAELGDGTIYIGFMGTDDTIVGWKEDFNMSYQHPIPAQIQAVSYIDEVAAQTKKKMRIGGHSKGGNLAVYGAVRCKAKFKKRIINVYNNDGPGFDEAFIKDRRYQEIRSVIKLIVPQYSVVGMLFEHDEDFIVVKSSQSGIMQHDGMSWQVEGNQFEYAEGLSKSSRVLNEVLKKWMNKIDMEERDKFVNVLFSLITASGATTLSEISADRFNSASSAFRIYQSLDRDTKVMMRRLFHSLTGELDKARKKTLH